MFIFLSILASILLSFIIIVFAFMQQEKFGKKPSGERLERIKKSPNFKNGAFQNVSYTPSFTEGTTYWSVLKQFFFERNIRVQPTQELPAHKTDLHNLDSSHDALVWFGHSSYFMQIDGKRILVDPVLSGSASPLSVGTKAFKGANNYSADDIPEIDFLFITHDHWDHLDYDTIKKIKPKVKQIITGLGTGEHLEHWGYDKKIITEADWNEQIELGNDFIVNTVTARHFSGRGFIRNKAIWISFVLQTPSMKVFIGGDSGYDKHFKETGEKFGPFDLALLENGQYNAKWRYIHMLPTEIHTAIKELNAKRVIPVHSAKFALSNHDWDEPLELITKHNEEEKTNIITPMIGQHVDLKNTNQVFEKWWKSVK